MPGLDALRHLYPAILSITSDDVERYKSDQETYEFILQLLQDLKRARKREFRLEGWSNEYNPFTIIDLDHFGPPQYTDVMATQYEMTIRANAWLGIGLWSIAEEYYKISIQLASVSNDKIATLQNGANLAMCYLGAGDSQNAFKVCNNLLPATIEGRTNDILCQTGTIIRMALIGLQRHDLVIKVTSNLSDNFKTAVQLNMSAYNIIMNVYEFTKNLSGLQGFQRDWNELKRLYNSYRDALNDSVEKRSKNVK